MAELTEVATDAVDKVVEETDRIAEVSRRLSGREFRLFLAGVGVGAVAVAVAASIQERRLRQKYSQLAEDEIDQMREHFRARTVAREEKPPLEELQGVVEDAGYSSKTEDYTKASEVIGEAFLEKDENLEGTVTLFEELAPEVRNIFKDQVQPEVQGDGWNYETELARREGATSPYVIHEDEQHEMDFSETEFTYYEGDDVTCDAENRIVMKPDALLGSEFREKFGHGSNDPNTVFIRNGMIAADIEVTRMPGMYSVEVQGLDGPEYDEYDDPQPRSTKFDDDD